MPYSDRDYKVSNVNYLNKDFSALKNTLVDYAKTYFPNSYRDFNETSPGMMLIEMAAYVGDVLSFYIDQQYKEMLLPLAEERRNVINIANMLGYNVSPIAPAYVNLSISQVVPTAGDLNNLVPNYTATTRIPNRTKIQSTANPDVIFETLDVIDFEISGSAVEVNSTDSNGIVSDFKLTKKVRAISGETKTTTFTIGTPQKFLKLTLPETNVIDILEVQDSNNNEWFGVNYLAQDYIPIETYYTASNENNFDDINQGVRATAYTTNDNVEITTVPTPYSLQYHRTSKKFITEVNDDSTTSLVFGNGILRNGQINQSNFLQTEQVGIIIPGETQNLDGTIDPLLDNDNRSTLGETPAHTTLTVTYRIGGGIGSNVPSGDLTSFVTAISDTTVTNDEPAFGGSSGETIEEIRHNAKAYFASQNRCVTQEDYEARVMAMPAKFGAIAKVFVERAETTPPTAPALDDLSALITTNLQELVDSENVPTDVELTTIIESLSAQITTLQGTAVDPILVSRTIDIHLLSYNENKQLEIPNKINNITHPILLNLGHYLGQYRLLTDEINAIPGKVINFGVAFEVVAHRSANKNDVKLKCINAIKNYFKIDKMQFRQPLYTNDLIYELMGLDGVRSVNFIELTQDFGAMHNPSIGTVGANVLWYLDNENINGNADTGTSGYGWQYNFKAFYDDTITSDGVILPSVEPSVFELKFPNKDIKGRVI
jgi:hypothetical protein